MAQRIIGLDIGSWSVKAMVLESSLRRMSLIGLFEHHLPVDAHGVPLPGSLPDAVKAVLSGLDVDILTAGVPGVQVLLRELSLPFADDKRVSPVIGFQLESLLPRPLETVRYDWHVLKKTPEGAQLLCAAADKLWLEQWLQEVRTGGAEPRHLTLSALAMGNLVPFLDLSDAGADGAVAFIDLGHRSTQVTLVRHGQVEAIRALSRGGHQVTQALARSLGIAYADAEKIKHDEIDLSGAVPAGVTPKEHARRVEIATSALEPILRELKLTIDSMSAQKLKSATESVELGAVVLCGGMSRLRGMAELIEQILGVPVIAARPKGDIWAGAGGAAAPVSHEVPAHWMDIGLPAAALALEHMRDADPHRINLRRGDLAAVSDFGALRARAGWIAAFFAVLLVIFFVRKAMRISTLEGQEQQLAARLDEYGEKVLGQKPSPDLDVKARFDEVLDTVTSPPGSETDEVYPSMTAFRIFYEVTRIQKALNDEAEHAASAAHADAEGEEHDAGDGEDELGLPKPPAPGSPAGPVGDTPSAESAPAVEKRQVELNSFAADLKSANNAQATLSGSAFDIVTVESFATQLRQHPCFKKVDRQETKKTSNPSHPNWTDFTIKIEVRCDVPASPPVEKPKVGAGAPIEPEEE